MFIQNLRKDFIDKGLVKIEFRHFPLDVAAFNASKIGQCNNDGDPEVLCIFYIQVKRNGQEEKHQMRLQYI